MFWALIFHSKNCFPITPNSFNRQKTSFSHLVRFDQLGHFHSNKFSTAIGAWAEFDSSCHEYSVVQLVDWGFQIEIGRSVARLLRGALRMFPSIPGSASYHRSEHFCWSKTAKTAAVFSTCFVTTTFLQNLVLNWQYQVFPAKMTLVYARSLLFYEKILYS